LLDGLLLGATLYERIPYSKLEPVWIKSCSPFLRRFSVWT